MSETWLGKVITTIGGSPRIYIVRCNKKGADSSDLRNSIPYFYEFQLDRPTRVDGPSKVLVKVQDLVFMSAFQENEQTMHHGAIQFGLHSIRTAPETDGFELNNEAWTAFKGRPKLAGQDLRTAVLRFFHDVNSEWPQQVISWCDLLDNFNNDKDELSGWIRSLMQEEYLLQNRGFGEYWLERGHLSTHTHLINSKLSAKISQELQPKSLALGQIQVVDPQDHMYFKLVKTQTETLGTFAFVLMPFEEAEFPQAVFDDVFRPLVREVLDINCVKVDNDKFKNYIENKIFSHIVKCELVIAELSTENPNVIFELGMALSFGRPLIPTYWNKYKKSEEGLAFDYKHFDTIFYGELDELKNQLREALEALKPKTG